MRSNAWLIGDVIGDTMTDYVLLHVNHNRSTSCRFYLHSPGLVISQSTALYFKSH